MAHASANPSPSASGSFAGLLASLATPSKADAVPDSTWSDSTWNDSGLGDDVVTLSYEQALRHHARYRPASRDNVTAGQAVTAGIGQGEPGDVPQPQISRPPVSGGVPTLKSAPNLRTASVTIRLRGDEAAQLRQRAAEAGLTISAYLRSCVLEADALRAQVKEALAQMKNAACAESAAAQGKGSWLGPLKWFKRDKRRLLFFKGSSRLSPTHIESFH